MHGRRVASLGYPDAKMAVLRRRAVVFRFLGLGWGGMENHPLSYRRRYEIQQNRHDPGEPAVVAEVIEFALANNFEQKFD